jgi:DNA polymerase (family 10)
MMKRSRSVVGFYKERGKTKPITKSAAQLRQKKVVAKSRRFKSVSPSNEVVRLAKREYAFLRKYAKRIEIAGSIRRRKPDPSDIDFVIIPKSVEAKQAIYKHAEKYKIRARGEQLLSYWLLPRKRAQVDIYFADSQHYGAMLLFVTGPGEYNIALRAKAITQGLKLNQYGVWKGAKLLGSQTEREVYDALLYPYKSPELRGLSDKEAEERFGIKPGQRVLRRKR